MFLRLLWSFTAEFDLFGLYDKIICLKQTEHLKNYKDSEIV